MTVGCCLSDSPHWTISAIKLQGRNIAVCPPRWPHHIYTLWYFVCICLFVLIWMTRMCLDNFDTRRCWDTDPWEHGLMLCHWELWCLLLSQGVSLSGLCLRRQKSQDSHVQRNLTGAPSDLRLSRLSDFISRGRNISSLLSHCCSCLSPWSQCVNWGSYADNIWLRHCLWVLTGSLLSLSPTIWQLSGTYW